MSLETQIAALIEASNSLTNAVAEKMGVIDQELQLAIDGVPAAIVRNMGRVWHLDQVDGDDANDGRTSLTPVRNLRKIANDTPAGAAVEIRVKGTYQMETSDAAFTGAQLLIRSYGDYKGKLKFTGYVHEPTNEYAAYGFIVYRNTSFNFYDIDIELPDVPTGTRGIGNRRALIETHTAADIPNPLSIRMGNVSIIVPDSANNPYTLTTGRCLTLLHVAGVSAPREWLDNAGLFDNVGIINNSLMASFIYNNSSLLPA